MNANIKIVGSDEAIRNSVKDHVNAGYKVVAEAMGVRLVRGIEVLYIMNERNLNEEQQRMIEDDEENTRETNPNL